MKKRGEQIKGRRKKHDRERKREYKHLSSRNGWSWSLNANIMIRSKLIHCFFRVDVIDDDVYDDEIVDNENNDEEQFQIQWTGNDKKYVLVNTRIDYQYRSAILSMICACTILSAYYTRKK